MRGYVTVVSLLVFLLVLMFASHLLGIGFNDTSSMPIGFYKVVHTKKIVRGDIVLACLPKKIAVEGLKRGYLGKGNCPSGAEPVLKEVIAMPGDTVRLTNKYIIVNGKKYDAPRQNKDSLGRPMTDFVKLGLYRHTHGYWLYGSNDPVMSWDSRYYGEGIDIRNHKLILFSNFFLSYT